VRVTVEVLGIDPDQSTAWRQIAAVGEQIDSHLSAVAKLTRMGDSIYADELQGVTKDEYTGKCGYWWTFDLDDVHIGGLIESLKPLLTDFGLASTITLKLTKAKDTK
jgi:hypothetical protein